MTLATAVRRPRVGSVPPVLLGAGAAWLGLLALAAMPGPHASHGSMSLLPVQPWSVGWAGMWLLMVAAMMWPLTAPMLDAVRRSSYPAWRSPLVLACLASTTVLWLAFGLVAGSFAHVLRVPAGSVAWQAGWLLVAVAATRSAWRARVLWTCLRLPPLAPGGGRGVRSSVEAGLVAWRRCAVLCGPMMVAMAVLDHRRGLVLLACTSATAWWEAAHPRRRHDPVPVVALLGATAWVVLGG